MQVVRVNNRVVVMGNWRKNAQPVRREMTLEEEVRRNGLDPVVRRMKRQGNWEMAAELLRKFRYNN
jgi:hypothetical protein